MTIFRWTVMLILLGVSNKAWSQTIYVQPNGEGLDQLVIAEILEQKVPLTVVSEKSKADFILSLGGSDRDSDNTWSDIVAFSQSKPVTHFKKAAASMTKAADGSIVWARNFDDYDVRTVSFSYDSSGGLAKKIVKRLSKDWLTTLSL